MNSFDRNIAVMLYLFLGAQGIYGQASGGFCDPRDAAIYYGNGVGTGAETETEANRSLLKLQGALTDVVPTDEYDKLEFKMAFNTSGGLGADLIEAVIQDLSSDFTLFWRLVAGIVPMPDSFRDKLVEFASSIDEAALLNNQDLSTHVTSYKTTILEGKKVILVSHSQGNFFGNQAYGNLSSTEQMSFGMVAAANPDSSVAGGGRYTTLVEDLVILAITLLKAEAHLPGPLPPNTTNFFTLADLSGHTFRKAYLASNSNSRTKILFDIVDTKAGIATPQNAAGEGIITVTLTWGTQPDVDLHAFEPNGTHVYYANSVGPSGFLDVDDVTSFGPEHYFVACGTLETGTYAIGVNYFSGSAPEVANVLIEAGLETRGFSIFLPSARGFNGDASPIPVANIVVIGNEEDGFQFMIQ